MPAFLIVDADITDQQSYDEYRRQVAPVIARFGGRFIVRGGDFEVLEGSWQPSRIVIIEFPTMDTLKAWYQSPEYAPLLALRRPAARAHVVAVEGC